MLSDIASRAVESALKRMAKDRWVPPTSELDDLRQEAWVAVLEAQADGTIDPEELRKRVEHHLRNVILRESRPEVPVDPSRFSPRDE